MKMSEIEKERKERHVVELLKLAGCLDEVDNDVAELCIKLIPKDNKQLISLAELMEGVQKIKDNLKHQMGRGQDES